MNTFIIDLQKGDINVPYTYISNINFSRPVQVFYSLDCINFPFMHVSLLVKMNIPILSFRCK